MKYLIFYIILLFSHTSMAQGSGDFDPLFGIDTGGASDGEGNVLIEHNNTGINYEYGTALYFYNDGTGRILLGGNIHYNSNDIDMVVTMLSYDGSIDTSFGNNGHRIVAFDLSGGTADNQDTLHDIQVDINTGHIYLIGSVQRNTVADTDFAVARLTSDGDLDNNFAPNSPGIGKLTIPFDMGGGLEDIAYAGHLKYYENEGLYLYLSGHAESTVGSDFAIAKIYVRATNNGNAIGDLDTGFNGDGKMTIDFPNSSNSLDRALGIYDGPGSLFWVVGYQTQSNGTQAPAIARIEHNGTLDQNFDDDGRYVKNESRISITITDVAKHPTTPGEFIFVGSDPHTGSIPTETPDCSVSYVNDLPHPAGIAADSFNFNLDVNEGTILELNSTCHSVTFGFHGELIIAGHLYSSVPGSDFKIALMRFSSFEVNADNSSYSIDLGFGVDGKKNYFFTDDMAPNRPGQIVDTNKNVIIDGSKKILLIGQATNQSGDESIAITRLIGAGSGYPLVTINSPVHGSILPYNTNITFNGEAFDNEDGDISSSITWSSSIDGQIGNGASFNHSNLSTGLHTITATVSDSNGQSDFAEIFLEIDDLIFKSGFE